MANLLKRLLQVEADLTSDSCEGRPIFARLLFLTFCGSKKDLFFVILFSFNFHRLEALCFVLDVFAKWRTIVFHERQPCRHLNTTTGR